MSQLAQVLLDYDLGTLRHVRPFTTGTQQTNLDLETDQGRYAFRVYENRSPAYVRFELNLLRDLSRTDYPTPAPIPTVTGALTGSLNGKPSAIFTFMEGEHDAGNSGLGQVAAIVGQLHSQTAGWQLPDSTARGTYDPVSCLRTAEHNLRRRDLPEAAARLTWLRDRLKEVRLSAALPRGICHCDPNPTNFLSTDGRLSAVLDFDMAAVAPLVYDVGCLLYWWACPGGREVSLPRAREVLAAYQTERPLIETERQHVYDFLLMVMLMGAAWSAAADNFWTETKGVETLRRIGRAQLLEELTR